MVSTLGWGGKTGGQLKRRTASVLPPAALASRAKAQPAASVAARMMATRTGGDGRPRKPQASGGEGAKRLGQHSGPPQVPAEHVPALGLLPESTRKCFETKCFCSLICQTKRRRQMRKKGKVTDAPRSCPLCCGAGLWDGGQKARGQRRRSGSRQLRTRPGTERNVFF